MQREISKTWWWGIPSVKLRKRPMGCQESLKNFCCLEGRRRAYVTGFALAGAIAGILPLSCLPGMAAPRPLPSRTSQMNAKLPVVRTQADLKRFDRQRVRLLGRYERLNLPQSARPGAPTRSVVQPMTGIPGFEPGKRPYAQAQIVLEDGWEVFIFPLWNKQSLRSPDELEDYESQAVEVIGVVSWEQGDDPAIPQAARLVGSSINLEQLRLNLRESKLYDPRSLVQGLAWIAQTPALALKSWKFLKQWQPSDQAATWSIARDYQLEMTAALPTFEVGWQKKFPNIASDPLTLTLFRNLPKPVPLAPAPGPNGEQSAFSTGGEPSHVVGWQLKYEAEREGTLRPGWTPTTFLPTVQMLAKTCLGATEPELRSLNQFLPTAIRRASDRGQVVRGSLPNSSVTSPMQPFKITVEAQTGQSYRLVVALWRQDSVESRRVYCDLEPRTVRLP